MLRVGVIESGKVRTGEWAGRGRGRCELFDPAMTGPDRVPESEFHLDKRSFEPVPQGEAVGSLGQLRHEAIEIGP